MLDRRMFSQHGDDGTHQHRRFAERKGAAVHRQSRRARSSARARVAGLHITPLIGAAAAALIAMAASAFDLEGHRGARGLAPENTLAAFKRALSIGVTTIETDLAVTRDDVLVISHDPLLNPDIVRHPDGRWLTEKGPAIRTLTLAELKRYDVGRLNPGSRYATQFPLQQSADGERFPTLRE